MNFEGSPLQCYHLSGSADKYACNSHNGLTDELLGWLREEIIKHSFELTDDNKIIPLNSKDFSPDRVPKTDSMRTCFTDQFLFRPLPGGHLEG